MRDDSGSGLATGRQLPLRRAVVAVMIGQKLCSVSDLYCSEAEASYAHIRLSIVESLGPDVLT
jgi:hypothetical protein